MYARGGDQTIVLFNYSSDHASSAKSTEARSHHSGTRNQADTQDQVTLPGQRTPASHSPSSNAPLTPAATTDQMLWPETDFQVSKSRTPLPLQASQSDPSASPSISEIIVPAGGSAFTGELANDGGNRIAEPGWEVLEGYWVFTLNPQTDGSKLICPGRDHQGKASFAEYANFRGLKEHWSAYHRGKPNGDDIHPVPCQSAECKAILFRLESLKQHATMHEHLQPLGTDKGVEDAARSVAFTPTGKFRRPFPQLHTCRIQGRGFYPDMKWPEGEKTYW